MTTRVRPDHRLRDDDVVDGDGGVHGEHLRIGAALFKPSTFERRHHVALVVLANCERLHVRALVITGARVAF
jgi:hypothetical protein